MRYSTKTLLILTAIVASLLAMTLMVNSAIKTRVLASVDHPNGTRLRVVQYFNYQPELFTTSIYFDNGDGNWHWYYFDHEDSYWGTPRGRFRMTQFASPRQIDELNLILLPGNARRFIPVQPDITRNPTKSNHFQMVRTIHAFNGETLDNNAVNGSRR